MILLDTSVWIEYFKHQTGTLVEEVKELLDEDEIVMVAPIWIELLSGASTVDYSKLKKLLSILPRYYPKQPTWKLIEKWIEYAKKNGYRFGVTDLLIAAICNENRLVLWSLDKDFTYMEKLKFVKLYK